MMFTEPEKAENVTQYNLGVVQLCELKTGIIAKVNHTHGTQYMTLMARSI